ncbi:cap binding protein [Pseudovirgaria hyperparasitica]|uniref:Cap binding protein n=1 Tax=Pseudovirgaria hyperparasitica TaxID=470096 RepID=A0A6A6VZY1_9PEZI|nr:cap binding protein [Pseudovirgaria hyperparasitica]KAF2755853.1 cap binding protein [Pseudovirgaria hyperparasitica]
MADMDSRDSKPRHGGRGYHNKNGKRRYREDDDYDRQPQRRKIEEPAFVKVRRCVLQLGDSGTKIPATETQEVAKKIAESYEDSEVKGGVLDLVIQFCVEQPLKIPIMAALCQYANDYNSDIAVELLTRAGKQAQAALEKGSWREFKLLLRFLACCQSLYNDDGVFGILDELFNSAAELQAASSADTIGLEIVKIILLTIPYVLATSATGLEQKAAELLEKTGIVASAPHALESLVEPYHGAAETENFHRGSEDRPYSYKSLLGLLQDQIQQEANMGWKLPFILRAYVKPVLPATEGDVDAAGIIDSPKQHPFPVITMPNPVSQGPKALFPEAFYSIYADQDIETVPKTTALVGTLVRDTLVDTINILDFNRHQVAKFLIDMDNFWAPGTFVKRATPFDKLRDIPSGESTWKPEDVAIDALFSQIFVLPSAEHKLIYYHSIITESCKIAPAAIAPSLGRAIRFLFRNLDGMDMELSARFMDWFAHHLSNFEFRWKWTEWTDDLTRPAIDPKKAFIVGALDKEIRLSFAKRIRSTLPPEYHHLITEAKEKDIPDFKYNDERTPYATYGRELLALIRKKAPEETVDIVMNQIHDEAAERGIGDVHIPSTDAYITCILFVGSKSLSHALSIIDRCKDRLLSTPESARIQIVQSVVDYWSIHPGTAVSIIDKLLNYTILSPMHVIQWALGPSRLKEGKLLSQPWVYEMVSTTMHKVTSRVRQIAAARLQVALPPEQIRMLDEKVTEERQSMRELFAVIAEATQGLAAGATDGYMEAVGANDITPAEAELLRAWGARWNRVFARKGAVEEAVVGEAVMEMRVKDAEEALQRLKQNEAEVEAAAEAAAAAAQDGHGNGNGDMDMDTAADGNNF